MYHKSLVKYTSFLIDSKYIIHNLTFSERSKLLAHLIYYIKQNEIENNIYHYTVISDKE